MVDEALNYNFNVSNGRYSHTSLNYTCVKSYCNELKYEILSNCFLYPGDY